MLCEGECHAWATACVWRLPCVGHCMYVEVRGNFHRLVLAVTVKSGDQSRLSYLHSKCQYENQRVLLVAYKNAVISCNSRLKRKNREHGS